MPPGLPGGFFVLGGAKSPTNSSLRGRLLVVGFEAISAQDGTGP